MKWFVIEYCRSSGDRTVREVGDSAEAMRLRFEKESTCADGVEVVALCASSLEGLTRTHSRYFCGREVDTLAS